MTDDRRIAFQLAAVSYENGLNYDPQQTDLMEALYDGADGGAVEPLVEALIEAAGIADGQTGMRECWAALWAWEDRVGQETVRAMLRRLGS